MVGTPVCVTITASKVPISWAVLMVPEMLYWATPMYPEKAIPINTKEK